MEYLDHKANWEEFFTKEYSSLQAKLPELASEKSNLRLALENKILEWKTYESWAMQSFGCASIKEGISEALLTNYLEQAKTTYKLFSSHTIWNQDLVPVFFWENQLIVFGLHYHPGLARIANHIFIFASPKILNNFSDVFKYVADQEEVTVPNLELSQTFSENTTNQMSGDDEVTQPYIEIEKLQSPKSSSFQPQFVDAILAAQPLVNASIWEVLSERYEHYFFQNQKSFQAMLILKIKSNITEVFKLDEELTKKELNQKLFEYNVTKDEVFNEVYKNGVSVKTLSQTIGLDMLNYVHLCVAPIKSSDKVVGFFVGFKNNSITPEDVALLEGLTSDFSKAA